MDYEGGKEAATIYLLEETAEGHRSMISCSLLCYNYSVMSLSNDGKLAYQRTSEEIDIIDLR